MVAGFKIERIDPNASSSWFLCGACDISSYAIITSSHLRSELSITWSNCELYLNCPWKKRNTSTDPALGRVDLVLISSFCDFSLNKAYIGAIPKLRLPKYGCKAEREHKCTLRDPALGWFDLICLASNLSCEKDNCVCLRTEDSVLGYTQRKIALGERILDLWKDCSRWVWPLSCRWMQRPLGKQIQSCFALFQKSKKFGLRSSLLPITYSIRPETLLQTLLFVSSLITFSGMTLPPINQITQ